MECPICPDSLTFSHGYFCCTNKCCLCYKHNLWFEYYTEDFLDGKETRRIALEGTREQMYVMRWLKVLEDFYVSK